MATSTGSDVIVVTISRSCAKQLLLALTLALGGTPYPGKKGKKGKGKKSGAAVKAAAVKGAAVKATGAVRKAGKNR
jgi:hypothetical protein